MCPKFNSDQPKTPQCRIIFICLDINKVVVFMEEKQT